MAAKKQSARSDTSFEREEIAEVFAQMPTAARKQLLRLRALIFETASSLPAVGPIEEALRWGEPSYLTSATKSGTTIRIHWKERQPDFCAMYVHCQTDLVERYRQLESTELTFEGNRAVLFRVDAPFPRDSLRDCVTLALTYHSG